MCACVSPGLLWWGALSSMNVHLLQTVLGSNGTCVFPFSGGGRATSLSLFHAKWGPGKPEGRTLDLLLVLHVCEMKLCGVALELEEARRRERPSSGAISSG